MGTLSTYKNSIESLEIPTRRTAEHHPRENPSFSNGSVCAFARFTAATERLRKFPIRVYGRLGRLSIVGPATVWFKETVIRPTLVFARVRVVLPGLSCPPRVLRSVLLCRLDRSVRYRFVVLRRVFSGIDPTVKRL